ncbi:MAG: hypothetical protein ACRC8G_16870 [Plesiomonas shigelloides]
MKGTLQYYSIDKFGFYKRGSEERTLDSDEAILNSFMAWLKQRPNLVNTGTREADKRKGQSNVYCYGVDGYEGDYVFVLWNELTNADNEILLLPKNSKFGDAKVKSGVNSETVIAGLPSYYWISLKDGFVATIHFDHAMTSIGALKNYITYYVQNYSSFAVTHQEDENKVIGYRYPLSDTESNNYFKLELKRKIDDSTIQELTQKYNLITKIVRRTKIVAEDVVLRGFFHNLASESIKRGLPKKQSACVEVEIEFTPSSESDFTDIVKAYENEITDPDQHNNLGFILKGESGRTRFLDGQVMKTEHEFEMVRKGKNPFAANELLDYILRRKIRLSPKSNIKDAA